MKCEIKSMFVSRNHSPGVPRKLELNDESQVCIEELHCSFNLTNERKVNKF